MKHRKKTDVTVEALKASANIAAEDDKKGSFVIFIYLYIIFQPCFIDFTALSCLLHCCNILLDTYKYFQFN